MHDAGDEQYVEEHLSHEETRTRFGLLDVRVPRGRARDKKRKHEHGGGQEGLSRFGARPHCERRKGKSQRQP